MDKDSLYIEEIKLFCKKILEFSNDINFINFTNDEKLQLALIKLIENIGEAAKRISSVKKIPI